MNEYGVKLSCHGFMMELVERQKNESVLDFCHRAIGCNTVDIVMPHNLDDVYCIVVDDNGLFSPQPRLNVFASYLYGAYIHGQVIVGNAVLMKNRFDDDGVSTIWFTKEEAYALVNSIGNNVLTIAAKLNEAIKKV